MKTVLATVYRVNDTWLVPTMAETRDGFYIESEPVEEIRGINADELSAALERVARRDNPVVRTPKREEYGEGLVVERAGLRTWNEFSKRASNWSIEFAGSQVTLTPTTRSKRGSFDPVEDKKQVFPSSREAAEALVGSAAGSGGR